MTKAVNFTPEQNKYQMSLGHSLNLYKFYQSWFIHLSKFVWCCWN